MRLTISRLAAWAGTTPRAIRHYHRTGVLPEPARTPGGYRTYGLEDLGRLLRVRRLVELGLPLARVAEVLADADTRERLHDVLRALDADLERQETELVARRRNIRVLLDASAGEAAAELDRLRADLVAAFGRVPAVERELDVVQVIAHEAPEVVPEVVAAYRRVLEDDAARDLSARTLELFQRLAVADAAGEQVPGLEEDVARRLVGLLRHAFDGAAGPAPGEQARDHGAVDPAGDRATFEQLAVGGLTPAQRRVVERARELLAQETNA